MGWRYEFCRFLRNLRPNFAHRQTRGHFSFHSSLSFSPPPTTCVLLLNLWFFPFQGKLLARCQAQRSPSLSSQTDTPDRQHSIWTPCIHPCRHRQTPLGPQVLPSFLHQPTKYLLFSITHGIIELYSLSGRSLEDSSTYC